MARITRGANMRSKMPPIPIRSGNQARSFAQRSFGLGGDLGHQVPGRLDGGDEVDPFPGPDQADIGPPAPQPTRPRPPALDTAAASIPPDTPAIGARTSG